MIGSGFTGLRWRWAPRRAAEAAPRRDGAAAEPGSSAPLRADADPQGAIEPPSRWRRSWSIGLPGSSVIAAVVFALAAGASAALLQQLDEMRIERQRAVVTAAALDHARAIEAGIDRSMSAALSLAALIRQGNGRIAGFAALAAELLPFHPGASHFALAPDGVVREVAPLAGNEAAIGLDLFADPAQRVDAVRGRDSGRLTLAGPLDLKQGGRGLIGRMPVMLEQPEGGRRFWGFVQVVMRLPSALDAAGLARLTAQGYRYRLTRVDPETGAEAQIEASPGTLPLDAPVRQVVELPNGRWMLALAPGEGWGDPVSRRVQAGVALLICVLLAGLAKTIAELAAHKCGLERRLAARTAEIVAAKRQLEAIFDAIPDPIWLKDPEGVYLACNPLVGRMAGAERDAIIGRTDRDFFDRETADFFRAHDLRAMQRREPSKNEEWLTFRIGGYRGLFETVKTPLRDADGGLIGVLGIARDITARERGEQALRDSETRLKVALEAANIAIWEWDLASDCWHASDTYATMLGYPPEEGPASRALWLERVHPEDRGRVQGCVEAVLAGRAPGYEYQARIRHADGGYRWIGVRGKVVEAHGGPRRMLGVRIDIDDLKRAEERIHRLAHYDVLTGLPNRTWLHAHLREAIASAREAGRMLALIFVDLDRFKNVNDTLGHQVGDQLLVEVGRRMVAALPAGALVSRQGGDEFVVVLPDADPAAAEAAARALQRAIGRRAELGAYELVVTPSMGIAMFPRDGADFDTLFRCADIAMYRAKHGGRDAFRFFTAEMQARSARILQIETALHSAVERGELHLQYQPQMSLRDGQVIGAEALVRWQHPELGAVSPGEFIRIAEDSGQILKIGEWVLREAVAQMKRWIDGGIAPAIVAVNLSAVQFREPDLPQLVAGILAEAGLPPERLELELTEGVAMDDPMAAIATIDALHGQGIRLSIDDFGTGYSSLAYLKRFHIDKLKIDQSFVRQMTDDGGDRAIVQAIIRLADSLGLQTIAEGVETEAQWAMLRDLGCAEAQGYWYARPLAAAAFEAYVRTVGAG